ncbi:c-type cytochrome [Thalassospiraceae bacterium LMO-JJ14]|nr:c-type cytochrome [Thalassospiraceae bacterium LMO-JJ14]
MDIKSALAVLCLFLFAANPVLASHHGDPKRGAELAQQCVSCHGVDGTNNTEGFPSLSNQKYKYLVKQLREMRNSAKIRTGEKNHDTDAAQAIMRSRRTNEIMDPFIVDLSNTDIEDLAAYYAAEPCRAVMSEAPLPPPRFEIRCQVCHGQFGIAANSNVPNIAGQDAGYLEQQLRSFQESRSQMDDGQERRRAPIMEGQVRHLSEQDIKDISLYYARLPCR